MTADRPARRPVAATAFSRGGMRFPGLLLSMVGILLLMLGFGIGVPFAGIYLLGFVGTGGREAGRELFMFLPATLICCGVGFGCVKLGQRLRRV